jgi:hypothetical protein
LVDCWGDVPLSVPDGLPHNTDYNICVHRKVNCVKCDYSC